MTLELGQIADWIHAEGEFDSSRKAVGYSIDSRTIGAGELFFAVKGERVDGHDFVEAAIANGAVAAVVSMRWLAPAQFDECMLLRVPDDCEDCVLDAMQKLANRVRRTWARRVIGITGSAGKTTTKECIAQVLAAGFNVLKTEGNFNNHFGLPLTLLRLEPTHDVAVVEMGMNHAGEITALAAIAEPSWGVVSNVGAVHTEHFTDGIEGVAKAKAELVAALPADGITFLNGDDERVRVMSNSRGAQRILFGTTADCAVRADNIEELGIDGSRFRVTRGSDKAEVALRLMGRHNVLNALAAIAVGTAAGIALAVCADALAAMAPTEKRGDVRQWNGARIINDCYNSNPKALAAMIGVLRSASATRRILIAGEMLELGPEGAQMHAEIGALGAAAGIDTIIGVRGLASNIVATAALNGADAHFVETPAAAGEWMRDNLRPGDLVLLKASRGVRLERALVALEDSPKPL